MKNDENNIVLYKVNTEKENLKFNFQILVEKKCGNFKIVGTLKDIGFTYVEVIFIICILIVLIAICFFGIAFCITYEIIHRNKKGKYYKQKNEKKQTKPEQTSSSLPNCAEMNQSNNNLNDENNK